MKIIFSKPTFLSFILHFIPILLYFLTTYLFKEAGKYFQDFEIYEDPSLVQSQQLRIQVPKEEEPKKKEPEKRAVFGRSRDSITSQDSQAPQVKLGNTVAQKEDSLTLNDEDASRLPIPAAEYMVTSMPRLLNEVRIPYPEETRKKGIEGPVVMELLIDSFGMVKKVDVLSGPDQSLIDAALKAIYSFRFSPAQVNEEKVAVRIRYEYAFKLE